MFRLNFSKFFSDFSLRKEKTDMFIHTWKNQHKNVYADFKSGIDKVADGDLTLLYNMYVLMKDCVPPEAQSFYCPARGSVLLRLVRRFANTIANQDIYFDV